MSYNIKKEQARTKAINWQHKQINKNMSWQEILNYQEYFYKLAKKYGLIKEFKENGII